MRSSIFVVLLIVALVGCKNKQTLFTVIDPEDSGIKFENRITENQALSVLNYEYIYNGGGVGIGDFNNDSLPDIYFTGNMVSNKMYLNKGDFKFDDITAAAGVDGKGKWCKGISVVDINNDGWQDIYVSAAVANDSNLRKNLLYVNQGLPAGKQAPVFKEMAEDYGLADASNTHMAAFFDYDNDGDLDVYLLLNDLDGTYPNEFRPIRTDGSWPNTDKLLQNNYDSTKRHAVFTDVSKQAGILIEGHGLGVAIADINQDGWKDIYVSNDYLSNNIMYINNGDGTFTDRCAEYLKHTSKNAMGNDIADINNDGLPDIVETDMAPADNYRLKMMFSDISYQTFQNSARFGYMHQYPRNTLQLNRGITYKENDTVSHPAFAEIAYLGGVAQTDWSWAPLLVDADNDGYRDLFISNGLPKDMSDLDFMAYRKDAVARTPLEQVLNQLPEVKVSNYAYRNNGDLTFSDLTADWGWSTPTFSAGMASADFDRDGDVDMVINNTNMPATLLRNTAQNNPEPSHYINVKLRGTPFNRDGIGSIITIYYGDKQQVHEQTPYRGYMSTVEHTAHFGLGNVSAIDSIAVVWPDQRRQLVRNPAADATVIIDISKGDLQPYQAPQWKGKGWFTDNTGSAGLMHASREVDFIDFNIQRLIPHKLTQYGPSLAVGDINGDGLDDLIVGGGSPVYATVFTQQANGKFASRPLVKGDDLKYQDDAGLCLFDADGDDDLDLYIASGGAENEPQSKAYVDHFYENDGKGNFEERMLPVLNNRATKGAVKAADFDNDGDLDLFVAGRVIPGRYPMPASSFIYRNDSKPGSIEFTDVTQQLAPELLQVGMVTDAMWSDVNNDNYIDLMLSTEWGPIITFQNNKGVLKKVANGLETELGWWNSLASADIDNDGDIDFVAGNYGRNGFMQASKQYPVGMYGHDFDGNTSFDAVMTCFFKDSMNGGMREFAVAGRDEFIKEMTVMKERFPNYASYARTDITQFFSADILKSATVFKANNLSSSWIENKGGFQFAMHSLPLVAQLAPVYGMVCRDLDGDGFIDLAMNGNEFSMAPYLGRNDALDGLVLKGNGKGEFAPVSIRQSGFYVPGNGKALVELIAGGKPAMVAGQNSNYLRLFTANGAYNAVSLNASDRYAMVHLKQGGVRRQEFGYGSGFLSQSGRHLIADSSVSFIEIFDHKGNKRIVGR